MKKNPSDQLRALQGTWEFAHLEIDGSAIPAAGLQTSRVLIDGDRFRTESPEATYEGIVKLNVKVEPHEIDIEFIAGPEAGNTNFGIFRLKGDQLEICLDLHGKPRPKAFRTAPGSGHAYETLKRTSHTRPELVTGGTAPPPKSASPAAGKSSFNYVESPLLTKLQGQWTAVKIIRDGQDLPAMMLRTALRAASKNEVKISFGGQNMIHALVKLDETTDPIHMDYYNVRAGSQASIQLGLMKWIGEEACFCMAAPAQPRPTDFTASSGSGHTFSQWRRKK